MSARWKGICKDLRYAFEIGLRYSLIHSLVKNVKSLNKPRSCCLCFLSFVSFCVPAGGSMPWDYFTQAFIQAVVWLQSAGALTQQAIHDAVARIAQTLRLCGPTVYHAA